MKIEYRLDLYELMQAAIREISHYELRREEYQNKGFEWGKEEENDEVYGPILFEESNIKLFFIEYLFDKTIYPKIIDAAQKIVSDYYLFKHPVELVKFTNAYFASNEDLICLFNELLENENIQKDDIILYLIKLEKKLAYFPSTFTGRYKIINCDQLSVANNFEKGNLQKWNSTDIQDILDIRDNMFSFGYFWGESYLEAQDLTEIEELARVCVQRTLEDYWSRCVGFNKIFRKLINDIEKAIDNKWDILKSKYKRGVYLDEWGVRHDDAWIRELTYFATHVVTSTTLVPKFFLFLDIDTENLENIASELDTESEHLFVNFKLMQDYESDLWKIKKMPEQMLEKKKEEFLIMLCNYFFSRKLVDEEDAFSDFDIFENESDFSTREPQTSSKIGVEYEFQIKDELEKLGYTISMTPITGDQGVDLIALRDKKKIAIQCKNYSGQVSNSAVQEVFAGKIFYDCNQACVVTNSSFTASAYQLGSKLGVIMSANDDLSVLK